MTAVDDIKSRLDILEVVSGYVPLQRSGRSYKANCPFHQEKTPSFFVFPDRQTWRCFGACATGGDIFSFVMRRENVEFAEALKQLAQRAGVDLPQRQRRNDQQVALQVNEAALLYFRELLASARGAAARKYLEERGLNQEYIARFELGLSPRDGESLKNQLVKQGFTPEQLALSGVATSGDNGRYRDLFRGRLMIPIRNSQGELGGFGSRALDDSKPKYLNSPRTPVFDKGRILFALNLAKESAREKGIVIVEGYMDAIMAHQHGFDNVVASMGTALTEHQVDEVRRVTSDITMALDPDAAGQQATLRSLESSWKVFQTQVVERARERRDSTSVVFHRQDLPELKIAVLPDGLDPDEVIRRSPQEWAQLVDNGVPLMEYLFTALSSQVDVSTSQGKARLVELMFPLIAAVPEPTRQDQYFQMLASQMGVSQEALLASVGRPTAARSSRRQPSTERSVSPSAFAKLERDPVEDYCLAMLLQHPELLDATGDLRPEYFRRMEDREIYNHLLRVPWDVPPDQVLPLLRVGIDRELTDHLEYLLQKRLPPTSGEHRLVAAFQDTVHRLEERYLRELKQEEEMRFAELSAELLEEPHQEVISINQRLKRNQELRNRNTQSVSHKG